MSGFEPLTFGSVVALVLFQPRLPSHARGQHELHTQVGDRQRATKVSGATEPFFNAPFSQWQLSNGAKRLGAKNDASNHGDWVEIEEWRVVDLLKQLGSMLATELIVGRVEFLTQSVELGMQFFLDRSMVFLTVNICQFAWVNAEIEHLPFIGIREIK